MKRELIQTSDGSMTIFLPEMNENYHSGHGAYNEAMHVFIRNGLEFLNHEPINVFEMGFGTGLNALLSFEFSLEKDIKINYSGIEAFPVENELIEKINYNEFVQADGVEAFKKMHAISWNHTHEFSPLFSFKKIHAKIEDYVPEKENFDVVFYDAFGPRAQKEMWDISILTKMYEMLKPDGILVTYCANGQFKRDLKQLGFRIEALPGPPGKREMTRAIKI